MINRVVQAVGIGVVFSIFAHVCLKTAGIDTSHPAWAPVIAGFALLGIVCSAVWDEIQEEEGE